MYISPVEFYTNLNKELKNGTFEYNNFIKQFQVNNIDNDLINKCISYCVNNNNIQKYNSIKKDRNKHLQSIFRNEVLNRYNKRCIVTGNFEDECQACHIIPLCEINENLYDVNNGLFLSSNLHNTFDKNYWTINPYNLKIEILKYVIGNSINKYDGLLLNELEKYPQTINYLKKRYKKIEK
jgi:predicted restriction endonuclease